MIKVNGFEIKTGTFTDGTIKFDSSSEWKQKFYSAVSPTDIKISWKYENDTELFKLMCIVDMIKRFGKKTSMTLDMLYIPNARQDRVYSAEESFSLKVFASVINSLHFDSVRVLDPHSNVSVALLDNVEVVSVEYYFLRRVNYKLSEMNKHIDMIVCPDAGAHKRYGKVKAFGENIPHYFGNKVRNWETGEIEDYQIVASDKDSFKGKNAIIIDDICSKGDTVKCTAKALKALGVDNIYLYVSHCENGVDLESLSCAGVTHMFTSNSIFNRESDFVTVLD